MLLEQDTYFACVAVWNIIHPGTPLSMDNLTDSGLEQQFSLPLNDDIPARLQSYSLVFTINQKNLVIDIESADPFDESAEVYFQLRLLLSDPMEYHVYFKDELLTYNLRKTLMKILHAASRYTFDPKQKTALISTLQVLKLSA